MDLFRLRILVKFFVPPHSPFFKIVRDIALKLSTHVPHHYLHQQTIVLSSVKVFVRSIALFRLTMLVKFFVPPHFFSKPLRYIAYSLTILIYHHYLHQQTRVHNTFKVFFKNYGPFCLLQFWLSYSYQISFSFQNN